MALSVRPLSPALGAEITGVDLREPLDAATIKAVNDAFDQHVVVVFRDQQLSEDDQVRAAGLFFAESNIVVSTLLGTCSKVDGSMEYDARPLDNERIAVA